jgi:hypothetical protein
MTSWARPPSLRPKPRVRPMTSVGKPETNPNIRFQGRGMERGGDPRTLPCESGHRRGHEPFPSLDWRRSSCRRWWRRCVRLLDLSKRRRERGEDGPHRAALCLWGQGSMASSTTRLPAPYFPACAVMAGRNALG